MANISKEVKDILSRSAKFVDSSARRIAKATKFKASELKTLGKRRDLINDLGSKVYELCKNGLVLPVEAGELVQQIAALDQDLTLLRADRAAQKAADAQQRAAEKASRAAEKAAAAIEKSCAPVDISMPEPEAPEAEIEVTDAVSAPEVPTLNVTTDETAVDSDTTENDIPTLNV